MPKLVVMLRVKDGIFFVHEWLENIERIVDEIVVVDNGSTDGTYEALKSHSKVVDIVRTEGFDEGRDKNLMYANARKRKPDWCLWLDVDEIFEPEITRANFDKLMKNRFINKYGFRRFHFIDREYFAGSRARLYYSSGHDRVLWREAPSGYFENLIIDSPNVKGISGLRRNTNIRIKHLGYVNKEIVDKKAAIYRTIIPEKEAEFQSMYLRNERRIRWRDDRKSLSVQLINFQLDLIRMSSLLPRAFNEARKVLHASVARISNY